MKCLTCALLFFVGLLPSLISAYPSTVVVNGVCLTCPNRNGERVVIDGQEYSSFDNGNVIVNRPGYNNGGSRIYRRGGTTIVNGRCEICNVDV